MREGNISTNQLRLDASESVWFKRELDYVDKTLNETIFPENLGRLYVPTQPGVPDWANTFTWRMFTKYGRAKIVGSNADDLPRADVSGDEESKIIKDVGAAYGWTIRDIKRSAATGTRLDSMKAMAARFAIDAEIDRILALGDADHNLDGLLNLPDVDSTAITNKTGMDDEWMTTGNTGDEISADIAACVSEILDGLRGGGGPMFRRFTVLIPDAQHAYIAQKRMSNSSDVTILKYILQNNPYVEAVEPWHHCAGAGDMATDRMIVYPRTPLVVAGIVPQEFTPLEPEKRGLEYVIDCLASTGGVVNRYPLAIRYMDGI